MKNIFYKALCVQLLFYYIAIAQVANNKYFVSVPDKYVLITTLYNETHPERIAEYKTCLEKNLNHPLISAVTVLYDVSKDDGTNELLEFLRSKSVQLFFITGRASFESCFALANKYAANTKIIIANADIYFDESLNRLQSFSLENVFIALSRSELSKKGIVLDHALQSQQYSKSQDVWIFKTPVRAMRSADTIFLGTCWCDCRISFEAKKAGYKLYNPCHSIHCIHMHQSAIRDWKMTDSGSDVAQLRMTHLPSTNLWPLKDDFIPWQADSMIVVNKKIIKKLSESEMKIVREKIKKSR